MTEEKLAECVKLLREKNSRAAVITTPWQELSGEMMASALSNEHAVERVLEELEHDAEHNCCLLYTSRCV